MCRSWVSPSDSAQDAPDRRWHSLGQDIHGTINERELLHSQFHLWQTEIEPRLVEGAPRIDSGLRSSGDARQHFGDERSDPLRLGFGDRLPLNIGALGFGLANAEMRSLASDGRDLEVSLASLDDAIGAGAAPMMRPRPGLLSRLPRGHPRRRPRRYRCDVRRFRRGPRRRSFWLPRAFRAPLFRQLRRRRAQH